jgi:enoyl-CoA hydratase/carnithine racemase
LIADARAHVPSHLIINHLGTHFEIQLVSKDETNRLTRASVRELHEAVRTLQRDPKPLILTGNAKFFSAGAELGEIQEIAGSSALDFARRGQDLMNAIAQFPAPVYAAIHGYCMGGGLDLALACHRRVASVHAIFGHRGAALGLVTGWGGTQRLPRLVGKGRALAILVAEKLHAKDALAIGLIDATADDPVAEAARRIVSRQSPVASRQISGAGPSF